MSLNTAHVNGGVLIHAGECILLFSEDVSMDFSGQDISAFKGTKVGRIYLTTHRMIFNNNKQNDALLSFSFPFVSLSDVELEQPVFGANYIKGKVRAQQNGNWVGEAKFKLVFKKGGAIDFAQAMIKAADMASRHGPASPPPYSPPAGPWYQAPPPAYSAAPTGYYGWVPPVHAFPSAPPVNSVYMTDMPPPYPGINANYMANGNVPPNNQGGAVGFAPHVMSAATNGKAPEPYQYCYYDPNKPYVGYVPAPPGYNEPPPSYQEANKKNQ